MIDELYPHQVNALQNLSNGKILWGGVGSGKTRVAVEYYKLKEAPKHVYVITTAKKRDDFDWQDEFYNHGIGPKSGPTNPAGAGKRVSRRKNQSGLSAQGDGSSGSGGSDPAGGLGEVSGRALRTLDPGRRQEISLASNSRESGPRSGPSGPTPGSRGNGRKKGSHDKPSREGSPFRGRDVGALHDQESLGGTDDPLSAVEAGDGTDHVRRDLGSLQPGQDHSEPRKEDDGLAGTYSGDRDSGGGGERTGLDSERETDGLSPEAAASGLHRRTTPARSVLPDSGKSPEDRGSLGGDPGRYPWVDTAGSAVGESRTGGTYPWVVTVDSWNNINKYAGVEGAFFIFDEQRLVGSGEWTKAFLRISRRNTWILLSATPGDTWMDYVPVFVANNFYKNRTAFKREHVVYNTFTKFPKVDRYINVGRLVRLRKSLLVEMPYVRHTQRRHVEVPLPYDKDAFDLVLTKRWHVYEDRPLRDVGEMCSVARKVVNGDPSRLEMVKELWKIHPKLIVFYNFNYELESLRSLIQPSISTPSSKSASNKMLTSSPTATGSKPLGESLSLRERKSNYTSTISFDTISDSSTSIAEWNGHKHESIPRTDRWIYLVQYTAGAEGWNCTETDAMIMYSRNYSWRITEQAYGRIDRLNTPFVDLWYYGFTTDSWIDKAIERSLRAKETFNEAKYASVFRG